MDNLGPGGEGNGTGGSFATGGSFGTGGGTSSGTGGKYELPAGYTPADLGGWKLDPSELSPTGGSTGGSSSAGCGTEIAGIVRDFKRGDPGHVGHPDFQVFYGSVAATGLVKPDLLDQKPEYSGTGELGSPPQKQMTSKTAFDQWFHTDENPDATARVNKAYKLMFSFAPSDDPEKAAKGMRIFKSTKFFPLNGAGFGSADQGPFVVNAGLPDEKIFDEQNFFFTTEVHTKFAYKGGEIFSFSGDDDLWVFVNGKLALDLGGLHPALDGTIDLDADAAKLGIEIGQEYTLDLFQAERGMPDSNFTVETSLEFTECGIVVK